jgi:hypothetical protein
VDNREGQDFFVYGIDVPMAGETRSAVTVNGKFTIKGDGTDNTQDSYWGILTNEIHGGYDTYKGSRWAPVGVYLQGKHKSFIDLNGDVDIRVKGIGVMADNYRELAADAYTDKINMNKGKIYIETPVDTKEGYYSLSSFGGTVNVNMNEAETASLSHDVNIIGNLIAMTDDGNGGWSGVPTFYANGKINLGLSTPTSTLTGIIDNTGTPQAGVVNIFLSKGAFWDHKSVGLKNGMQQPSMPEPSIGHYGNYDGISHLTNLVGGSGGPEHRPDRQGRRFQDRQSSCGFRDHAPYRQCGLKHRIH